MGFHETRRKYRREETYVREFQLTSVGSEFDRKGDYVHFTARPVSVRLEWTRSLGKDWERTTSTRRGGSRIVGYRVLKDGTLGNQSTEWDVFGYFNGRLSEFAAALPGLADLIKRIEASELPK
jgi:hypothetical protein